LVGFAANLPYAAFTVLAAVPFFLGSDAKPPLWQRLDPVRRAKLMMALLALVLLGVALVALVMIGGRIVRRLARRGTQPSRSYPDDWYTTPLVPKEPEESGPDEPHEEPHP
jgi:hypothetical protein